MPLKLDFDEFEDDYPQIDNQRFSASKFSLKSNFDDESIMREKVASDVVPERRGCRFPIRRSTLYVDHGNGPYFGLYTLVEEIDDTVIDTQFSSDDGNLYKPEDGSANFVEGTFSSEDFEKKPMRTKKTGRISLPCSVPCMTIQRALIPPSGGKTWRRCSTWTSF